MPTRTDVISAVEDRFLTFMNGFAVSGDPREGMTACRNGLMALLGDVDRISISVNYSCDLRDPAGYNPQVTIAQHITPMGAGVVDGDRGGAKLQTSVGTPVERLVQDLQTQGFPLDDYYPPDGFAFYVSGSAYLGTLILWRLKVHPPISSASLSLMSRLEPFLIFVLSDMVARRQHADPDVMKFSNALQQLAGEVSLSRGEQRVVLLQLFGHSYKAIADILGVTMDAVKHHLKVIHRKTGTRSFTELFAKYFMPRLDLGEGMAEPSGFAIDDREPGRRRGRTALDESAPRFDSIGSLGERMRRFGELAHGSVQAYARALKMAPANLQKYLGGAREPGPATLARLLALGCNLNGLLSGRGDVFADNAAGMELRRRHAGRSER